MTALKVLKSKHLQPRILHPGKIHIKTEGEFKTFSNKSFNNLSLEILQTEGK